MNADVRFPSSAFIGVHRRLLNSLHGPLFVNSSNTSKRPNIWAVRDRGARYAETHQLRPTLAKCRPRFVGIVGPRRPWRFTPPRWGNYVAKNVISRKNAPRQKSLRARAVTGAALIKNNCQKWKIASSQRWPPWPSSPNVEVPTCMRAKIARCSTAEVEHLDHLENLGRLAMPARYAAVGLWDRRVARIPTPATSASRAAAGSGTAPEAAATPGPPAP
jgi:hypothetical protein